jgi:hypothetical protein
MEKKQSNNEEEVDLGSLFIIIGRGFSKFFNFIGSIFKGIFHFFIVVLIFLKVNSIKIGIAVVLGALFGYFLEFNKEDSYVSEMLLQPNFESTRQLYDNLSYYNDLVKQRDTVSLQKTLYLSKNYAASLKKFTIEPIKRESDIIKGYSQLVSAVDSTVVKSYSYDDFKKSFEDSDYKIQKITVIAEKSDVFNKLGDVIISDVIYNKYFKRKKNISNENLNRTDSLLRRNLGQIDSLRKVYMQVMLEESKKQSTGTSIDLGGQKRTTKELELFETSREINEDIKEIGELKSEQYEVINVVSNFQAVGKKVGGFSKNSSFLLGCLGGASMILFLLLLKMNRYLNTYIKNN